MEKCVYLTTPDYMRAFIVESKMYSFSVKAYPNSRSAYQHLFQTNLSSILGFVFFYEELPEDLTYLVRFINFLNLIGNKDTLVLLAVNDPDGVKDYLFPNIKTGNITFKYITDFSPVTDSFIKRSLLGTVVLHNFEPYVETINSMKEVTSYNSNEPLTPILSGDILSILSPIFRLNNSDNTIKHDEVMLNSKNNGLVMYLRINFIKASFGDEIDLEGMKKRVDSVDGLNRILYYSIINIIKTKREKVLQDEELEEFLEKEIIERKIENLVEKEIDVKEEPVLVGNNVSELEDEFDYENAFNYQEGENDDREDEDDLSDLL